MLILFIIMIILLLIRSRQQNVHSTPTATPHQASKGPVIVIDPGHGGYDPGKVSSDGVNEKDINLQIACLLKENLEERGYQVYLTRNSDISLGDAGASNKKMSDLMERIACAASSSANLLLSIHQNSFSDPTVHGAQVFYYTSSNEGKTLAELIQSNLKNMVDLENTREAKGNSEYVILAQSPCTSLIVECGFLSCPDEASRLTTDSYQEAIVTAIADSLDEYYK
jgi:N-acetylmuramoyl-L-alanine amidase